MNKKLIKTIGAITCGLGIISSIPFAAISCGCSNSTSSNILPKNVYDIQDNVLLGFKDDFLNNPDSEIYQDNFKDCDTMRIPANVVSIADYAFLVSPQWLWSTIPSFIKNLTFGVGSNCSSIGNNAFQNSALISVDLLNCVNLSSIGNCAFSGDDTGNSKLTSVILPSSLTTIGKVAFSECTALNSIDLSKTNLTTIGDSAFYNCSSLSSVTLPSSLTTIGNSVFTFCSELSLVDLSSCLILETIGIDGFYACSSLTSIDLSKTKLSSTGDSAFYNCSSLSSVTLPSSLNSIGRAAFYSLDKIEWESWVGTIDTLSSSSFRYVCQDGGTVIVTNPIDGYDSDKLLQYLQDNGGLPQTWKAALPESVYKINDDGILQGFKEGIDLSQYEDVCDTIWIPSNVKSVANNAFYNGSESIIPSFITKLAFAENSNCSSIGEGAFSGAPNLTSISLPSSLTTIDQEAFMNCQSLNYIAWDLPNDYQTSIIVSDSVFTNINSSGNVKSLNPSITSEKLLDWIKGMGDFPSTGWTAI